MHKWILAVSGLLFFILPITAQQLSDSTRLYLITCSPGAELFSKFGHSAIRAYDPTTSTDVVFNYGIFDFDTPNFYPKFIRGRLNYMLGVERTDFFFRVYGSEGREVKQQRLRLNPEQTRRVVRFLLHNYEPENRYYLYDFFYDNCATRIRDLLEKEFDTLLIPDFPYEPAKTFRQLVNEYVSPFPWADFGIDLILGLPADKKAGFRNEMFLPDYLSIHFDESFLAGKPLVTSTQIMVPLRMDHLQPSGAISPVWAFSILLFLMVITTWFGNTTTKRILDAVVFLSVALAGCLFLFMWMGTDHQATWKNFNLLWASPFWIAGLRPERILWRITLAIAVAGAVVALIGFPLIPQQYHPAVIPLALLLVLRGTDRLFKWSDQLKRSLLQIKT